MKVFKNIIRIILYIPIFISIYALVLWFFYWVFIDFVYKYENLKTERALKFCLYYWQISSGFVGGILGLFVAYSIIPVKKKLLSTILFVLVCIACAYLIYFNASVKQYYIVAGYASLLVGSFIGWSWKNNI